MLPRSFAKIPQMAKRRHAELDASTSASRFIILVLETFGPLGPPSPERRFLLNHCLSRELERNLFHINNPFSQTLGPENKRSSFEKHLEDGSRQSCQKTYCADCCPLCSPSVPPVFPSVHVRPVFPQYSPSVHAGIPASKTTDCSPSVPPVFPHRAFPQSSPSVSPVFPPAPSGCTASSVMPPEIMFGVDAGIIFV